jgi:exodeoxyribonuclease V gamma subunit
MGYQIFTSVCLETLVDSHSALFQAGFFGARPWIVLQNQSLAQWLKLRLARLSGGYATGDFLFQDEALRRLLAASGVETGQVLFLDDLKLALYRHLSGVLRGPIEPVFTPLASPASPPDPLRLFELSDAIAGVFHDYAMNSGLWPTNLAAGTLPPDNTADPAAFAWQSRLWQDLLESGRGTLAGLVMARFTEAPPPSLPGPRPRLVLVGSAFLSRRSAAFLRSWADADLIDVVQLLLLPGPPPSAGGWPDTRPWSSWGAFGRTFLESLPSSDSPWVPGVPGTSALSRVQSGLVSGVPFPGAPTDGTLEVHSCPHPLRELEVLRDRLLGFLAADPGLEVHEIAVLAPDINVYAPFLDAAFGSDDPGRNLRFHVIDLDLGRENAWFRALDALLALVSGTIDRPNLFTLADTPAFRKAWELDDEDRDLWLDFTEVVSAWREEGDSGPQSWTAGWDRLFEGWFWGNHEGAPGGTHPLDVSPSAFRALGRFHQLVDGLRTLAFQTRQPRPFGDWIRFFDQVVVTYLGNTDGTGAALSGRLQTLLRDAGGADEPLPWAGFRAFVQDQIAHFPGRRGQLLTEGIHCSSLRPLRSIPFKVIAVLGLDEGRFPRQAPVPSFDLRRHEPGQETLGTAALDRYCFWETVQAARSALHLSYRGRSAVDGTELPPSPVLADLLDYLEFEGRPWPVVQASVKDFALLPGQGPTTSPRTWRRAQAVASAAPGEASAPEFPPLDPEQVRDLFPEVRTSEVTQAFTAPVKFHLKRIRQVTLREEDHRGLDEEEPWSLGFLERQAWLQEGLRLQLAGKKDCWDVDAWISTQEARGRVRPGVFADRDRKELHLRAAQVSAWATALGNEGWVPVPDRRSAPPLWEGIPWAPDAEDRLARGPEVLVPRLLYAQVAPARTKVETGVRHLLDPVARACLSTLNPSGVRQDLVWTPDPEATRALAHRAEQWWAQACLRPLPFYPDFLEAVAVRLRKAPDEGWGQSIELAWRQARDKNFGTSEATLARCPYAALAFPGIPDTKTLAADLEPWWESLFAPLLEAWG